MEVATANGSLRRCMCIHRAAMHPLPFHSVSMQDPENAPATRPRGPLFTLCVSSRQKDTAGEKFLGRNARSTWTRPGAERLRSPLAGVGARTVMVCQFSCAHFVPRTDAGLLCVNMRAFLHDRQDAHGGAKMHYIRHPDNAYCLDVRLSRAALDSGGVPGLTGWQARREQRRETGRRKNAFAA